MNSRTLISAMAVMLLLCFAVSADGNKSISSTKLPVYYYGHGWGAEGASCLIDSQPVEEGACVGWPELTPLKCVEGKFVEDCKKCGCGGYGSCNEDGACSLSANRCPLKDDQFKNVRFGSPEASSLVTSASMSWCFDYKPDRDWLNDRVVFVIAATNTVSKESKQYTIQGVKNKKCYSIKFSDLVPDEKYTFAISAQYYRKPCSATYRRMLSGKVNKMAGWKNMPWFNNSGSSTQTTGNATSSGEPQGTGFGDFFSSWWMK